MTFDDLAATLPNGFHDATLKAVNIDYVNRRANLRIDIWIGDLDAATEAEREAYKQAEVVLSDLVFWICEAPCRGYPYDISGELIIDIGPPETLKRPSQTILPPVPDGYFVNWIFVNEWNAFIFVAARDARLTWLARNAAHKS